jgi:serine/threonine-protein kinase
MTPAIRLVSSIALASMLLLPVHPALAQTEDASKLRADVAFQRGIAALGRDDLVTACRSLQDSHDLDPALGTKLYLAECRAREGRIATSWTLFRAAATEARQKGQVPRAAAAEARARDLEARLPRLRVELRTPAPKGTRVTADGVVLEAAVLSEPIPLDPGKHKVVVAAPGRTPWQRTVDLKEASSFVLLVPDLTATSDGPTPRKGARETATPVVAEPPRQPMYERWWFWTGAGVLVTGAVAAIVLSSGPSEAGGAPASGPTVRW